VLLDGIRVLDLTRLLPGAYATLMLADLGCDVIKIEDPRGGDHTRQMPPLADGTSAYFKVLNRDKRSVTLNLRSGEAAEIIGALAERCDVVVDSFRPKTASRLGVDAPTLLKHNPRLVCASITGFGQSGPYVDRAAHDINYEALAGLLALPGGVPQVPGLLIGDIGAAYQTVIHVLAALLARARSGTTFPSTIDVSIHEAALQWMVFPSARHLVAGTHGDVRQLPLRGEAARYNLYETSDGKWLALGALEAKFWVAFCERIGRPDLAPLHDVPGDEQARAVREVRELMRTRTRDEWLAHFAGLDVCLTPVHSLEEALADPHVEARGLVRREGGVTYIGALRHRIRPAPGLGDDTDDVLQALGFDDARRRELRARGVI
jgi:crotonobetainyl-CoA:carnitine CoA-transferase CaiB-like acyl-CoA transferase